ncbi:T9SS type A sorting domain-containing protein [candidate division KSB1 bacterium]|nr:T9SS type A sorting domain-containing protein [candidate division KSB1 bacterium]
MRRILKMNLKYNGIFLLLLLLIFLSGEIVFAQSSPNYELKKNVIDMEGKESQSADYLLFDVGGQPSPVGEMYSNNYTLSSGFLAQAVTIEFRGTKLMASDGQAEATFGRAVAISGDYAVIGASHDNNENGTDAGAAYVFKRSGNEWLEQCKILASDGAESDVFGYAIAIDGDYAVIGAPWTDDNGTESGAAYIFKREGTDWIQQTKLTASDGGEDNRYGITAAISGDYVLVGAFFDDDFGTRSGSAYIYKRNGTDWVEQVILKADDGAEGDWFGVSVSIDGNFAAIGARYDDNENGTDAGGVYLFKRSGTSWRQYQKLIASDGADGDLFHKVELCGDHLIVGAYQDDDNGPNSGSVYVYKNTGSSWVEQEKLIASDGEVGEMFGRHVAVSENRLVIGANRDNENGSNSGSVYVCNYDGSNWIETEKIVAYDGDPGDFYGFQVDIDGDFILVASRNDDDKGNNAGAAYIYGSLTIGIPYDITNVRNAMAFQLYPAYPNPFNPETTIRYVLPRAVEVNIAIYNLLGQRIRLLENSQMQPGAHSVHWDGRDDAGIVQTSGIYLCRIQAGEYRRSIKLTLIK